jgi:hypothetical protein
VVVTVFLFVAGIRFGVATHEVTADDARVEYRAPLLPILRGSMRGAA